jgi:hypothetical protein
MNANQRPESLSHRSCSRRQQPSHDSDRSTRQRWRPSRVDNSIPRRAIRGRIPRRRSHARLAWLSYPLSAWTLSGRTRRRPDGVRTGGMSSTTAASMVTSATLAPVTPRSAAARRRHRPGEACSQACHDRPDLRPRGPPRLARTLMVSTLTRDQSTWPCSPSRSNTARCRASNTPAAAHSVSRRQQVAGEPQPSSRAGSSRQGVEVRAMNTIAAKQLRSGMARCRPRYGGRGGAGSKGSTSAHSSSGTSSSTRVVMACDHARPTLKERNAVLGSARRECTRTSAPPAPMPTASPTPQAHPSRAGPGRPATVAPDQESTRGGVA